jgi:DNA-binding NtrC family response regulator
MSKILVIDDERSIRNTLKEILEFESHTVELAEDGLDGIEKIKKNNYELVFCDIKMPKKDGFEVLSEALQIKPELIFIMISGHGNVEVAVDAIKNGAYDFIEKPLDLNRILVTIKNASEKKELVTETKQLRKKINKSYKIIGESEKIQHVKSMISKVADTDAKVLILGGNGTGKELVARELHANSDRNKKSFVEVNCAAIPSELIESELFGHEKGAFTSAHKQRKGKFEQANNGTLFLDEIGDMSLSAQAKVLRALQENIITPVGSDKNIKVNVRVVAATNKDLRKEIDKGNFREDLFHRLSVIVIKVPDLKDRKEDIPLLIQHFSKQICQESGKPERIFQDAAMKELQKHDWTGNIRELRNYVERLIILGGEEISVDDINNYCNF